MQPVNSFVVFFMALKIYVIKLETIQFIVFLGLKLIEVLQLTKGLKLQRVRCYSRVWSWPGVLKLHDDLKFSEGLKFPKDLQLTNGPTLDQHWTRTFLLKKIYHKRLPCTQKYKIDLYLTIKSKLYRKCHWPW